MIDGWGISCEIALIWMSLDFTDDQSTLVQVMAWCRQATSHYLSQCWPRSLSPYGATRPQWVKDYTFWIISWIWLLKQPHVSSVQRSQYHTCWCSGDFRSHGISKHGIDPTKPGYSVSSIKRVNTVVVDLVKQGIGINSLAPGRHGSNFKSGISEHMG